jgi:hypothetical protein
VVNFSQGVMEGGEFGSSFVPSVGDMGSAPEFSSKDFAGFIVGHDIARVKDVWGKGVFLVHAEGSNGALDIMALAFGSTSGARFMESSVQAAENSFHLPRFAEQLTVINEPRVSPFAGVVKPGVLVGAVDVMAKDHSGFEGAIRFTLSGSSIHGNLFTTW